MSDRRLRPVDELVVPAVAETVAALGLTEDDAALIRLAEVTAASIDAMPLEVRAAMIGQTGALLMKTLVELDKRAERRRKPVREPNGLDRLRAARAAADRRRGGL